ncbi:MAG: endonuclease [Gemmataceae bacterium]|nr:endonuclease [Gemmataceae bacterium]
MATGINKQKIVSAIFSKGKKIPQGEVTTLPVMEQVIYSICREGTCAELADKAYKSLAEGFFDWNEVRVSSTREIEDCLHGMSRPIERATRIIQFLQELFETTYSFEMEFLHKKGVKQATKHLSRYQAANDYLGAWVTQRSLGGHAIPLDSPTLRITKRLGLVDKSQEETAEIRGSLEHLIPKAKGAEFTDAISQIAVEFCHDSNPRCPTCPLVSECQYGKARLKPVKKSPKAKPGAK